VSHSPTMKDLSLLFDSTAELYTLKPIPAAGSMPSGWRIRLPMGDQHITADLFTLEPGCHGAYRLVSSKRVPEDAWESAAIYLLGDIIAVLVTEGTLVTDEVAESLARRFHLACAEGNSEVPGLAERRAALSKVIDPVATQWVTVRQAGSLA